MRELMARSLRFLLVVLTVGVLTVFGATTASADDTTPTDPQLIDVSKQVGEIQGKLNQLISRGQSARAGKLISSADCGYQDPSQPFLGWGDTASYSLAPQGDFSATDEWTLNKQASVVQTADPFSGAHQSLQLGHEGQAATPAFCVTLDNPTFRFFTRDFGGNGKANLKVDVLYEDFDGHVKHLTIAKLKAGTDWQPSIVVPIYMNMLAAASPSGVTAVAFQLKAEGLQKDETLSISSFYVDPYCSR
jgi:hypothetical protein